MFGNVAYAHRLIGQPPSAKMTNAPMPDRVVAEGLDARMRRRSLAGAVTYSNTMTAGARIRLKIMTGRRR
jgi:hypothetical protein